MNSRISADINVSELTSAGRPEVYNEKVIRANQEQISSQFSNRNSVSPNLISVVSTSAGLQSGTTQSVLNESSPISPQTSRKTLSRLQNWQAWNKLFGRNKDVVGSFDGNKRQTPLLLPQATVEEADTGVSFTLDYDDMDLDCGGTKPSTSSRFPLRKLKAKVSNSSEQQQAIWKPAGDCMWKSSNNHEVTLHGIRLEHMLEIERYALQKIVFSKVLKANLGCPITRPKDTPQMKHKRQKYVKKKAYTVNIIEKYPGKDKKSSGAKSLVFGIPISACVQNDLRLTEAVDQNATTPQSRCKSLDLEEEGLKLNVSPHRLSAESSKSSKSSLSDQPSSSESGIALHGESSKTSFETQGGSTEDVTKSRFGSSFENLLSSFSSQNSPSHFSSSPDAITTILLKQDSLDTHSPQVPKIVQACCDYLQEYGLTTIGLFRVAGSVKRCRQMRLRLDSGEELIFTEDSNDIVPHDIATLMKEYFRDLPNPLLTKELYSAFIAAAKLPEDKKIKILRYLVCLLPTANIDTLIVLIKFLQQVVRHSCDVINDEGISITGNKMNSYNLATIFGPTILRPSRNQSLSDSESVISVIQSLIDNCDAILCIPRQLQHAAYVSMLETDPEALDAILFKLLQSKRVVPSNDPSEEEETQTTVFYTTQEETFPEELSRDADGTMVIKTKTQTTHKIVYKIKKETDTVLESRSESFPPTPIKTFSKEDCASEFNPFTDQLASTETPTLIDPQKVRTKVNSPLTKLAAFSWGATK